VRAAEPEREMIRRASPFAAPAFGLALLAGAALGGWDAGWSAAIGIGVVLANFLAHGLSLAWASRISPTMIFAVGVGGFGVRMAAIVAVMLGLDRLAWFSPLAFGAAIVPGTIALLAFEMKLLSGRMQADLWYFRGQA